MIPVSIESSAARKEAVESSNNHVVSTASTSLTAKVDGLNRTLLDFRLAQEGFAKSIRLTLAQFTEREAEVSRTHTLSLYSLLLTDPMDDMCRNYHQITPLSPIDSLDSKPIPSPFQRRLNRSILKERPSSTLSPSRGQTCSLPSRYERRRGKQSSNVRSKPFSLAWSFTKNMCVRLRICLSRPPPAAS